jgi:ascorbate-specific PTS system EIIC-type component UlaA
MMNDPRDFLALARFGNLGILLIAVGLLGVLIHRQPLRQAMASGVCVLGVLLVSEGASLLHGEPQSFRESIAAVFIGLAIVILAARATISRQPERKPMA